MCTSKETIALMIKGCKESKSKLTEWEDAIIYSICGKYLMSELTEKQVSRLRQIWERVTENSS